MDAGELRRLLALANAFKEGDLRVGGTTDDHVRDDARRALAATKVAEVRRAVLIDDGVTAALEDTRDRRFDSALDPLTVGQLKHIVLGPAAAAWIHKYHLALGSEIIAAVVKIMTDEDLSSVARVLFNPLAGDAVAIGAPQHFGSRIQPNSAGDDELEILFAILEGLAYGCGDVIIGLNPAADDHDTIVRLEQLLEQTVRRLKLPTRYCVLSDIIKQHEAKRHARVDVGFQSLAGTSRALAGMVALDVDGLLDLAQRFDGLYFETGQGSEITNGAAADIDMVTLEARTYGVARHIRRKIDATGKSPWMIVNDVAGFIGPEVFTTGEQLERTCLEDTVMAKLHGLTMGLDVCATFHMGVDPPTLRRLTARILERAAPAYMMAVAGNADPMLGYLTTSFREHSKLRKQVGRTITTSMRKRLTDLAVLDAAGELRPGTDSVARLYAAYAKGGGDRRTASSLEDEGRRKLEDLRERGFDLGITDGSQADARLARIYAHARAALYAVIDPAVTRDVSACNVVVRTTATGRDDYLARPPAGERLREEDARTLQSLYPWRQPQVQLVISDGLNANAINEQLRALVLPLRRLIGERGCHVGETDVIVHNGRVRAGYEIGGFVGAECVIHVIGERPGTGLNALSAYITYGRNEGGQWRWSRDLDHSVTTAICGIHPKGKPPAAAATEIAGTVARIFEQRRSGVALKHASG